MDTYDFYLGQMWTKPNWNMLMLPNNASTRHQYEIVVVTCVQITHKFDLFMTREGITEQTRDMRSLDK